MSLITHPVSFFEIQHLTFVVCLKIYPGDHGQSLISGTDYISPVQGDKSGGSETSNSPIVGQKANGIALSDDVFEQNRNGLRADPSLASLPYIPSSFTGNFLDPLANKSVLSGLAGSSSHFD